MKLLLLRHALQDGAPRGGIIPVLSEKGVFQQSATNEWINKSGVHPDVIYSSPVARAVETGRMVAGVFHCPLETEEALGNDFQEDVLLERIREAEVETLCFIGHAPTLTDFAQFLVGSVSIPSIGRSCALILDVEKLPDTLRCVPLVYITPEGVSRLVEGEASFQQE